MAKSRRRRRSNSKPSGPHGTGARTGGVMHGPGRAEAAASRTYRRSLAAKKAAATRKRKRRKSGSKSKRRRKLHGAALAAWRRAHGYTKKGHKSMARKRRKGRSGRRRRKLHGAALAAFNRKHPHRKRGRRKPPRHRGMFRRRNPPMPLWLKVMIGAGAGLLVAAGSKAAARRFFPAKQAMVSDIAALAAIGAGVYLAKKRPFIGAGIAAGAAVGAVAPMLSAKLEGVGAAPGSPAAAASLARLEGIKYLEAVTADHLGAAHAPAPAFGMQAVTADNLAALSFDY